MNRLVTVLATSAPDVNPAQVLGTGATELRKVFSAEQVPGVLIAYMAGIKVALALTVAFTGLAFFIGLLMPWERLNKEAVKEAGGAA